METREVLETQKLSSLRVKLDLGMENGKIKTRTKSFTFLRHDAVAQDVFDVANAIMALQENGIIEVEKQDNTVISA